MELATNPEYFRSIVKEICPCRAFVIPQFGKTVNFVVPCSSSASIYVEFGVDPNA